MFNRKKNSYVKLELDGEDLKITSYFDKDTDVELFGELLFHVMEGDLINPIVKSLETHGELYNKKQLAEDIFGMFIAHIETVEGDELEPNSGRNPLIKPDEVVKNFASSNMDEPS